MAAHVVIPARYASSRLPGKPLADIGGVPMIVRVAEQVNQAIIDGSISDFVVAVDHQSVFEAVQQAGYEAMMTRQDHNSGSDRVMEVVAAKQWSANDVVINVQGDEPLIPPQVIGLLAAHMTKDTEHQLTTLAEPIEHIADFYDPNIVKVVRDQLNNAIYFSRAPIPFPRRELASHNLFVGGQMDNKAIQTISKQQQRQILSNSNAQRHIGIYAFRVSALNTFVNLPASELEMNEQLEQLRWLDAGLKLQVLTSPVAVPGGVDTQDDLERVIEIVLNRSP